jgi:hypothetical protein
MTINLIIWFGIEKKIMGLCEYYIVIELRLRNRNNMKKTNNYQPSLSEEELEKEVKELSAPNCP